MVLEDGPSSGYAFKYRKLARRDECAHSSQKQKHNPRHRVDVQAKKNTKEANIARYFNKK